MIVYRFLGLSFLLVFQIGCNASDSTVGLVSGTITLDGQPLEEAMVTFEPLFRGGSPSYGTKKTGANGYYEMQHGLDVPGVLVGKHRVLISTYHSMVVKKIPERVPVKYNDESELEREVVSGPQTMDFELTSD